ncbi:MAG: lysine exporter LysO family protein [Prevotellaceae bacterium]|nr:lysine exporter LysO family protein [Prevotellaceae bacterium]
MNLIVVGLMLSGMCVGRMLRRCPLPHLSRVIILLVWLLLFLLGIEVGMNPHILSSLHSLGLQALWLTLGAVLGSASCARLLWRWAQSPQCQESSSAPLPGQGHPLRGSLVIIGFFALGTVAGCLGCMPRFLTEGPSSTCALLLLMACVGVSVGHDTAIFRSFRQFSPRLMLLPLLTVVGTLAGAALVWLLLRQRDLGGSLAVASGMGYYSLSSIFLTEYRGAEWGTLALLSNVIREIVTLLGAPLLVRLFGPLAPISVGGATTMDTTLPIISSTSGRMFIPLSVFHGFFTDFSVPFLVTFFAAL